MKLSKTIGLAAVATAALAMTSCSSGPKQLTRTWDDWVNQKYSENSLIHGLILQDLLPVYPIVGFLAAIGDGIALNPYYFWSRDIWEGNGTAYNHNGVEGAQNSVGTLIESGE
ncbi:MAG: hypothetical protein R3F34_09820 [Planctomycetota bacterium]